MQIAVDYFKDLWEEHPVIAVVAALLTLWVVAELAVYIFGVILVAIGFGILYLMLPYCPPWR